MARRYSRVRQGARLNSQLENYISYLQTLGTRPSRIGQLGARNLNTVAYLTPFGYDVAADEVVSSRANSDHYAVLAPFINGASTGASVSDTIGGNSLVSERGFRAARIVYFSNASRSVTVETSAVTGGQYLKYAGERESCPFGRNLETDDQIDAFNAVKAAILSANSARAVNRVSLTRERAPI